MSGSIGWELGRAVLSVAAVPFVGIWMQLPLMRWASDFRAVAMWSPVIATPLFTLAALAGAVTGDGAFGWAAAALLVVAVWSG